MNEPDQFIDTLDTAMKQYRSTFIVLVILTFLSSFRLGVISTTVTGRSASGRTIFEASLIDLDYLDSATVTIDGTRFIYKGNQTNTAVVFDPKSKTFTLVLRSTDPRTPEAFVKFWAIPGTFRQTMNAKGAGSQFHNQYQFNARMQGTDPRPGKGLSSEIELICTMDHEL